MIKEEHMPISGLEKEAEKLQAEFRKIKYPSIIQDQKFLKDMERIGSELMDRRK